MVESTFFYLENGVVINGLAAILSPLALLSGLNVLASLPDLDVLALLTNLDVLASLPDLAVLGSFPDFNLLASVPEVSLLALLPVRIPFRLSFLGFSTRYILGAYFAHSTPLKCAALTTIIMKD